MKIEVIKYEPLTGYDSLITIKYIKSKFKKLFGAKDVIKKFIGKGTIWNEVTEDNFLIRQDVHTEYWLTNLKNSLQYNLDQHKKQKPHF